MPLTSQGTDLYTIDPDTGELLDVGCITSLDGIDTAIDQIETTCLNDTTRTYQAGLSTPGAGTFGLMIDPSNPVHVRLHQLKLSGRTLPWAVGWSDGTVAPTVGTDSSGDDEFVFPPSRSWIAYDAYLSSFPFTFGLNAMVTSNVGFQLSGEPVMIPKSTS